jgi:shikimate dehydrogenase
LDYTLFDFSARGWADEDVARLMDAAQMAGFAGLNITHPFKQLVLAYLDELAPSAAKVGAVNTVRFQAGRRIGHNTDVTGFAQSVERGLPGQSLESVIQFGAGGGGAATAHALLNLGVRRLILVDAAAGRRDQLAAQLHAQYPDADILPKSEAPASFAGIDGVVNATPVGMASYPGTPFRTDLLSERQWVADIVYFPLETQLLQEARKLGCATLEGRGMAVFQAADAFDIFTGRPANRERMLASFDVFDGCPPLAGAA